MNQIYIIGELKNMNYETLYSYIKAVIVDETNYTMDVIDSLKYNQKDFFIEIQNNLALANHSSTNIDITNLFCICAKHEQIQKIEHSISSQY